MTDTFKLKGLNRKGSTGVYATVECGKENWFHADFNEKKFPADRQYALFNYFKNSDVWDKGGHTVVVSFDEYGTGGVPINPIIEEININ